MEYRPLGNTGLKLPVLGFGASSLGQEFRQIDLQEALRAVHAALDCGLNFIDTSPFYGRGMSEVLLGLLCTEFLAIDTSLGTKLGRYAAAHFDFSAKRVAESIDVSLAPMGVEYLDICLCHDIEFVDMAQIVEETLPALRRSQQAGKVRFVGVSGYPMKMFRYVLDRAPLDVVLSYNHYTLQNTMLGDLVPYLKSKGVGIMNAAPFSARLLTNARVAAVAQGDAECAPPAAGPRSIARRRASTSPSWRCNSRSAIPTLRPASPARPTPVAHSPMGRLGREADRRTAARRGARNPQADPQLALHRRPAGKQRPGTVERSHVKGYSPTRSASGSFLDSHSVQKPSPSLHYGLMASLFLPRPQPLSPDLVSGV